MIESVSESFCERCGTRYEFPLPVVEKKRRGLGLKVLLGGHSEEAQPAAAALDPFLTVFRFCLECRQYTCPPCWNVEAGFCASCVPFPEAPPEGPPQLAQAVEEPEVVRLPVGPDAWPTADLADGPGEAADAPLAAEAVVEAEALPEPEAATVADAAVVAEVAAELEPVAKSEPEVAAEVESERRLTAEVELKVVPDSLSVVEPEAGSDLEQRVAWNQLLLGPTPLEHVDRRGELPQDWANLFDGPAPEVEAVAAVEPEVEAVAAVEPEVEAVAAVEPEVEAVAEVEPEVEVEPEAPKPQPTAAWSITAPDGGRPTTPAWPPRTPVYVPPSSPTPGARPQGMDAPQVPVPFPTQQASAVSQPAPAPSVESGVTSLLARALGQGPSGGAPRSASGVRPCSSCRLPLSANARFCRRCGTAQG